MNILKDLCTLADGQSACLAGIGTIIAIIVGVLIMGYVFFYVHPTSVSDISQILQTFAIYHSAAITTGCAGKYATNKAEPQS